MPLSDSALLNGHLTLEALGLGLLLNWRNGLSTEQGVGQPPAGPGSHAAPGNPTDGPGTQMPDTRIQSEIYDYLSGTNDYVSYSYLRFNIR
jgi:hypothetical protein